MRSAFSTLWEVAEKQSIDLQKHGKASVPNNYEEQRETSHPIYDSFLEANKSNGVQQMSYFYSYWDWHNM